MILHLEPSIEYRRTHSFPSGCSSILKTKRRRTGCMF